MGLRHTVGSGLESLLGRERTNRIRKAERRARTALADRLAPAGNQPKWVRAAESDARRSAERAARQAVAKAVQQATNPAPPPEPPKAKPKPAAPAARWDPPDPYVVHPTPTMSRHELMARLHTLLKPRTYFEIGVFDGGSLTLSRTRSIGVDPAFRIVRPVTCDLDLIRDTSDAFFARPDPMEHFGGVPVDFGFIDGMHLGEFAYRDFANLEAHMAPTGVIVFDDVLPRNGLEAARERKTLAWAGDPYKAVEAIIRRRPDLVVLLVNTSPTGTALICRVDTASTLLHDVYPDEVRYLTSPDPQTPPQEFMDRSIAVDPELLLASPVWSRLVEIRDAGDPVDESVWQQLRDLPTLRHTADAAESARAAHAGESADPTPEPVGAEAS